ncbi:MAG: asparagine synthase (glutamine-hydrolyzing), partial [bacterium]|nr:asparagine synthase (glutamine-hydrolyzing) [bacterium]
MYMCAIAGILGAVDRHDDRARVTEMTTVQVHRGPDAGAVAVFPGAVLGHRRLSIIDLSDRAQQPMVSTDGRYVLVFNGEIYNYRELRRELEGSYPFRTESDTEVLLAAWVMWGEAMLERLNGMFAFCLYDTVDRRAFFARDRFGQKPIHFAEHNGRLLFASEVKALLAAGVPAKPNLAAWARYLTVASYDDDADTLFAGVTQLRPGECAAWDVERGVRRRTYYALHERVAGSPLDVSVVDAAAEVRRLLVDAATIHMRADVPVGISLSGGLDSSAMLAALDLARELHDGVRCFSFDFGGDFTERPWIDAAASYHGLTSAIATFTPADFLASIRPMMWHLEGPIGGLSNCALGVVSRDAHAAGIVVLQDGTGLDEMFGGYRNHHNRYLGQLLASGDPSAARAVEEYARNWGVSVGDATAAARAELAREHTTIDGTIPVRPDLLRKDFRRDHAAMAIPPIRATGDPTRDVLVDYLQVRKIPRNTRMKDRLSMAHSIELRLPFLDHRLVEYALRLPPAYWFHEGRTKGIVREALRGTMDSAVRTATKRSIQAPQGAWLRAEPMRSYIRELIGSESFASRGIFDVDSVRAAYEDFCVHGAPNSF